MRSPAGGPTPRGTGSGGPTSTCRSSWMSSASSARRGRGSRPPWPFTPRRPCRTTSRSRRTRGTSSRRSTRPATSRTTSAGSSSGCAKPCWRSPASRCDTVRRVYAVSSAADLEARARDVLPADVYAYYATGSGTGQTLAQQEPAWSRVRLRPRVLTDVSEVTAEVTLLGATVASPVVVAPSALHTLADPEGEVATARGACAAGSLYVLSMRSGRRLTDVAAVAGPFWQQIYVLRDRGVSDDIARQAAELGAAALVLTVDTPLVARKPGIIPAVLPHNGI